MTLQSLNEFKNIPEISMDVIVGLDTQSLDNTAKFSKIDQVFLGKVISCYDGDTFTAIVYHGQYIAYTFRMYGYDSWEIKPKKTVANRSELIRKAKIAKQRLEELILDKKIYIDCKKLEKYGRILAVVKITPEDTKTVNTMMVEEGHGYLYFGSKKKPGDDEDIREFEPTPIDN